MIAVPNPIRTWEGIDLEAIRHVRVVRIACGDSLPTSPSRIVPGFVVVTARSHRRVENLQRVDIQSIQYGGAASLHVGQGRAEQRRWPPAVSHLHSRNNQKMRRQDFSSQMLMGSATVLIGDGDAVQSTLHGSGDHFLRGVAGILQIKRVGVQVEAKSHRGRWRICGSVRACDTSAVIRGNLMPIDSPGDRKPAPGMRSLHPQSIESDAGADIVGVEAR